MKIIMSTIIIFSYQLQQLVIPTYISEQRFSTFYFRLMNSLLKSMNRQTQYMRGFLVFTIIKFPTKIVYKKTKD